MKKRFLGTFLILFLMLFNLFMPSKAAALTKPSMDEIELNLTIVCKSDVNFSTTEYDSDGYPIHDQYQDKFTITLKGTAKYQVEKNFSTEDKIALHQFERDFKVTGIGGGTESGYNTNRLLRFTDSGWEEKKDFPASYQGAWRYRLDTSTANDFYIVEWINIIPPKGRNSMPKYEIFFDSTFFLGNIDEHIITSGSRTSTASGWDGTDTETTTYSEGSTPGMAPAYAMEAYYQMWEEHDEVKLEGELKTEGNKYTASGNTAFTFKPEDGENLSVEISYELNRKPTPNNIQVNQALGRYEYKNDEDFSPATDFVAGKDTAVQVFLPKDTPVESLSDIKLDVYRDGEKVSTLTSFTRDTKNNAVIFIPKSRSECGNWQVGSYKFEAGIGDKKFTLENVEFMEKQELKILAVPVKANYGGTIKTPGSQWMKGDYFLRRVYPVAYNKVKWTPGRLLDASAPEYDITTVQGQWNLANKLNSLQPQSGKPYDIIIGFIDSGITLADGRVMQGYTFGPPSDVVVNSDQDMPSTIAHEIAHLYGVGDEYNGGAYNPNVNKPPFGYSGQDWNDRSKSVTGSDEAVKPSSAGEGSLISSKLHPFEVTGRKLLGDSISFMGSGAPQNKYWITPSIWKHLFDALGVPNPISGGTNKISRKILKSNDENDRVVEVSGWVSKTGEVKLAPPFRSFQGIVEMNAESEEYVINVVDDSGTVVETLGFTPLYYLSSNPPIIAERAPFTNVPVYLPEGTSKLQIVKDNKILKEVKVSPKAPNISIISPSSGSDCPGETTIEWKASDPDGDKLFFTVEYSSDGSNWSVVESGITENKLKYDFNKLAGSDDAYIRITASDGINSSSALIKALKVPYKEPEIFLEEPVVKNDSVVLNGSAYDLVDGWLLDEGNLEWSSDRDGKLGGSSMLFLNNLSTGKHVITLKAVNSHGLASTETFTIDTEEIPSEFDFEYKAPASISPGKDVKLDVTLKAVTPGKKGYTGVHLAFSAEGPRDVTIKVKENGQLQTFTNKGVLGAAGFNVPADYNKTTQFTLNFPELGTYKLTFSLVDDKGNTIDNIAGVKTIDVTPKASLFSRIKAWFSGLWAKLIGIFNK